MICVVIKGPTFEEAYQQITQALPYADSVELRLDHFIDLSLSTLKQLHSAFSIPMIFTLRSRSQGGHYSDTEENRLLTIRQLAHLEPDYLDLESHIPAAFIQELATFFPTIKIILSFHDFDRTSDLDTIFHTMQQLPAFFYKIAMQAPSTSDALYLLNWVKKSDKNIVAISMGPNGQISRIIGPIVGSPITYAALTDDQQTAPGQLSARMLAEVYHYHTLSPQTALYGLIGDPITHSLSEYTHNHLMQVEGLDAVYVKMQVPPTELATFLPLAQVLCFRGLSVTMPLKEAVMDHLDCIDSEAEAIGAVNTLLFENGKITGFNTDGKGALNAIERQGAVRGKRLVILGAGGAAKAIAYEACRRGAEMTILNRHPEKAEQIARSLHCNAFGLDRMAICSAEGYDILINCTPHSLPIDKAHILPHTIVMDIKTLAIDTPLLQTAQAKGCRIVYGYQMFVEQAAEQFHLWYQGHLSKQGCKKIIESKVLDLIKKINKSL